MTPIALDVWADVVCPWCYLGKRRLEAAIVASERAADVEVTYHAFELEPGSPVGGGSMVEHLGRRYGVPHQEARRLAEQAAVAARPDGIVVDVDGLQRANTFDAHRTAALGLAEGGPELQAAVLERLFAAVFTEGRAVDDHAVLRRLGVEAGLDEGRLTEVLASDEYAEQVRRDEADAAELGVTGVPYVLANERLAMTGAHSVMAFLELIQTAAAPARR